jgi:hypothetical protein
VRARWLLALLLAPGVALAALGENSSTIERDVAQLRAQRSVATSSAYSVHELVLPGGTHVREYLTTTNQVFAVVWRGPIIPDLKQLLGSYFARYSAAVQAVGQARRPLDLQEPDLVIHTGGHMHAFFGVAYLPLRMPSGMRAEDIR